MKYLTVGLLVIVSLSAAQGTQTFTGTISDEMCARADHSQMRMGSNDAECATACVDAHGVEYVLYDGKTAYTLSGSPSPARFAGRKVRIVGTLDPKTRTIHVNSITATTG